MRSPVFAANWKMNHGPRATRVYLEHFLSHYRERDDRTVIICPPVVSLETARAALAARSDILLGVQNVFWEEKGAFTGETSPAMAHEAGASVTLVGHSERRQLFGETDAMTARKCAAAWGGGLTPMLCVGESQDERDRNETRAVVLRQLRAGITGLDESLVVRMLFAYEPVWAIGTGRTAMPADASDVHGWIRAALVEEVGEHAREIPVLYGGSVNADTAPKLMAAPNVDGLLVGGASLDAERWAQIACCT
ncbi:MAG: triose-phosphate isomerase [Gemmatimonadaceae bacterium]